ncbi:MAG: hypothetical protein RR482_04015 [Clostridia bacterium]
MCIKFGDPINFVVPTGNFGNILAGEYARRMGLPIGKLLCASNANHVLADFLETGCYDANRAFHQTISPSMDILLSSNLERYLFELAERDVAKVRDWMEQLRTMRSYTISARQLSQMRARLYGGWTDDMQTRQTICNTWDHFHYLADPHTAVAFSLLARYRAETGDHTPAVVVSTAHPYKFGRDVGEALLRTRLDDFAACEALSHYTGIPIPQAIASLPDLPIRHTAVCAPSEMDDALRQIFSTNG